MSFETTQTDLENVILSEVSQTETNIICYHLYEKLKNNINESVYKTKMDSKTKNYGYQRGKRGGEG